MKKQIYKDYAKMRKYKNSVKIKCGCGNYQLAKKGSRCAEAKTCSRCLSRDGYIELVPAWLK